MYATGTVESTVMLPLAPRSAARLVELNFDEGDKVSKGQILARLEDENLQNTLKQLQAKEGFAKSDFLRSDEAYKRGAISIQAFERAKSEWEVSKAAVLSAQAEAGFMQITAPTDGLIIRRDGEIGQLVTSNQPVFWFSGMGPLRISAEIDEEDVSLVTTSQSVLIRADAFPGKVFNGKVSSITPKGDQIARSYRVRIEFTEDVPLRIGMTTEINIMSHENKNALLIPLSSFDSGKIWTVVDGRLVEKEVEIGAKGSGQIEVLKGIDEKDLIVVTTDKTLHEKEKVRTTLVQQVK